MEIPGQQICNLKLHIQNLSIAEDHCELCILFIQFVLNIFLTITASNTIQTVLESTVKGEKS